MSNNYIIIIIIIIIIISVARFKQSMNNYEQ